MKINYLPCGIRIPEPQGVLILLDIMNFNIAKGYVPD
jgi:hypothetical protein